MQKKSLIIALTIILLFNFLFSYTLSSKAAELSNKIKKQESPVKISTITLTPTPTTTPSPTLTPTPTITLTPSPTPIPIIIAPKELDDLFVKYGNEYSVDKELLKRIANCESTLNINATAGDYAGLFQFSKQTWINTRLIMGADANIDLRFNAEESIKTAAFLISRGKTGIWPNCSK